MTDDKKTNQFESLQGDYATWLSQVIMATFFDAPDSRRDVVAPPTFRSVLGDTPDNKMPPRVMELQEVLHNLAASVLSTTNKPDADAFEAFLGTYESFQETLRQMEHENVLEGFGIDPLTGLRSKSVMMPELERELERRARRGQPFSIVISRIDDSTLRANPEKIVAAAKCIAKTIRTFDDAYITGDGEFLASLKHSDAVGGVKFIERLNVLLHESPDVSFSVSSLVAEPVPGEDLSELLQNMRNDLDKMTGDESGVVGQFEDISPLARYVQLLKDDPYQL